MIILTNYFIPKEFDGHTYWCFALIRPDHKDDVGLIAHEKTHVKQFWRRPFIHGIMYRFSDTYRQECEVEAYRAQIATETLPNILVYAMMLCQNYGLELSYEQALKLLERR